MWRSPTRGAHTPDKGAPVDAASLNYVTPLHVAVKAGAKDCLTRLIALGVDVNCRTDAFVTPLHEARCAARAARRGAARRRFADSACVRGVRAAGQAAQAGQLGFIAQLIDAGALVDSKDAHGRSPLHWAARAGRTDAVRLLLARHADINVEDKFMDQARAPIDLRRRRAAPPRRPTRRATADGDGDAPLRRAC